MDIIPFSTRQFDTDLTPFEGSPFRAPSPSSLPTSGLLLIGASFCNFFTHSIHQPVTRTTEECLLWACGAGFSSMRWRAPPAPARPRFDQTPQCVDITASPFASLDLTLHVRCKRIYGRHGSTQGNMQKLIVVNMALAVSPSVRHVPDDRRSELPDTTRGDHCTKHD